jgi:peptide/nickel transport system substrate-binding protein
MKQNLLFIFLFILFACNTNAPIDKIGDTKQIIHTRVGMFGEPETLNPTIWRSARTERILNKVFQGLLGVDRISGEITPVLAKSRPRIETLPGGEMSIAYELRPEAKWDNGSDITAKDVLFSLKTIVNPYINNAHRRPYFDFIKEIILDESNAKKVKFICKNVYIRSEFQEL